jgi:hypothetical protein
MAVFLVGRSARCRVSIEKSLIHFSKSCLIITYYVRMALPLKTPSASERQVLPQKLSGQRSVAASDNFGCAIAASLNIVFTGSSPQTIEGSLLTRLARTQVMNGIVANPHEFPQVVPLLPSARLIQITRAFFTHNLNGRAIAKKAAKARWGK